ncbi:MAG: hypothetical protein U0271_00770 [Polyangiaceae bacterium]
MGSDEDDASGRAASQEPTAQSAFFGRTSSATTAGVRASAVRVREQFVLAKYGRLQRELYRARASPALGRVLSTPGDLWVDFDLFIEATQLVCDLCGDGSPALARAVGAYGAEANMGAWRSLVHRLLSPTLLLEIAGMLWSHHYEGGRLTTEARGEKGFTLRLEDFPRPHVLHCASIEGWCERTLAFSRPRQVAVRQLACRARGDGHCEFQGDWD